MLDVLRNAIHFAPWAQAHCVRSEAATCRLKMGGREECGIAFGEAGSISSPPSRSQIDGRAEYGFGGWVVEKVETASEAAPLLSRKNPSTTFDNSSMTMKFWAFSSDRIVILIPQLIPTDTKQRRTIIHFAPWAQAHCVRSMATTRRFILVE